MIATLSITIIVEGLVILAYCLWRGKPLFSILLTSIAANVITQPVLWIALNVFFRHYLAALLLCETCIWLVEAILLHLPRKNQMTPGGALFLSFCMNLISLGTGWWLPV